LSDGSRCIVTSDLLMDGVDFELSRCDARQAGRKSLAVSLSDLAAMASRPAAAIVSLALPRSGGRRLAEELYEGLFPLADEFGVAIAGGDTNSWAGPLVVCVTAVGEVGGRGPLLRSGARPGDEILVTGEFGGSILGRHLDFTPRVRESLLLHEHFELHAGIDVSDGLSLDLDRLAKESGCGAVVDLEAVPISAAARELAAGGGPSALERALGDGEDFELVLAVPGGEAERILRQRPVGAPLHRIGRFTPEPGLWLATSDGGCRPLEPRGYEHRLEP
jgi:thiamine-monophosphate kinase